MNMQIKTNPYSRCQKLQSDLDGLRTSLGEVSSRCVSFFEEKPTSSSVPVLRSELNLAVEKIDRLHNLSSVYLHKWVGRTRALTQSKYPLLTNILDLNITRFPFFSQAEDSGCADVQLAGCREPGEEVREQAE